MTDAERQQYTQNLKQLFGREPNETTDNEKVHEGLGSAVRGRRDYPESKL